MKTRLRVKMLGAGKSGQVGWIKLPFDAKEVWGKGRVPVKGVINGYPFRTTVVRMAGDYCFCVNKEMREGAHAGVGDLVELVLEPDNEPRTIKIPPGLRKALGAKLTTKLQGLAYTHQKEFVKWFTDAKQEETRKRRAGKMKEMLTVGKTIS